MQTIRGVSKQVLITHIKINVSYYGKNQCFLQALNINYFCYK